MRLLDRDPVPAPYRAFPGIDRIELTERAAGDAEAVIVLECSDLSRPGVAGLDRYFVVNIDHHVGNESYGDVNWFDESAAACGEMVADLIDELGVEWTPEIAAHLYLAIATDTGGFRHGHITARTFEVCRRVAGSGLDPAALSRLIFDSFGIGRVQLMGAMLGSMELYYDDRFAVLAFDEALLAACRATMDDTEGLVNLPLNAREVVAVALFKQQADGAQRLSFRSKGDVDVRAVANRWGGGGHKNAAGCTITAPLQQAKAEVVEAMGDALGQPSAAGPGR